MNNNFFKPIIIFISKTKFNIFKLNKFYIIKIIKKDIYFIISKKINKKLRLLII